MEIVSKIQSLSDAELCQKLSQFRQIERDALSDLLLHLCELDNRKSYLDLGFSSLFSYLRFALGYSESSALRRIDASRVMRKTPELYWKVREGKLSLSAVCEIAKVSDTETQRALLQSAEGQSKREVQKLVIEHLPATAPKKERTLIWKVAPRPAAPAPLFQSQVTETTPPPAEVMYSMNLEINEERMKLLTEAKALVGGRSSDVIWKALEELVERHSPKKREERRVKRAARKAEKEVKAPEDVATTVPEAASETKNASKSPARALRRISRHIPDALRDKIIIRDEGRCTFVGPDGRRCNETHHLEVDHVQLFSFGGRHTEENLRLLCRPHNQLMAERVLGKEKMRAMRMGSEVGVWR